MGSAFSAVHVGDLHFWRYPTNPFDLMGKRILGVANLALNRARRFPRGNDPLLTARIEALRADWTLFSGDFTTTALDSEYEAAAKALSPSLERSGGGILAVPGNHDRYTRQAIRNRVFESALGSWVPEKKIPYAVELGEGVWLWGLDPTTSNGIGSFGSLKDEDVAQLHAWWSRSKGNVRELWILCHFPAEVPAADFVPDRGVQLRNADGLLAFMKESAVPILFLHGHYHHRWIHRGLRASNVVYVNAGAPMELHRGARTPDLGVYRLMRDEGRTRIELHTCDVPSARWGAREVELPSRPGEFADLES